MTSLESICIGIQNLIRALYTQFKLIYRFVALSKSNDIAIYCHGARSRPGRLVEVVQLRLFKAKEGRSYSILCDKYIPNPRLEPGVPPIRRSREVTCRIVTLG
jgi:hypothetical protein